MFFLYVKIHNKTGLKYLGQTIQDPYKYKGSGTIWKKHITEYGNDVSTYVIATVDTKKELAEIGLYYSKSWNVVESNEWANMIYESGFGGANPCAIKAGTGFMKMKKSGTMSTFATQNNKKRLANGNHNFLGENHPQRVAIRNGTSRFLQKSTCPHCGLSGQTVNMKRFHFDKCKKKEK